MLDEWSPTGWLVRLHSTDNQSKHREIEVNVEAWGPNGEPLVGPTGENGRASDDARTLVDGSRLASFKHLDTSLYLGSPFAATPGWSVQIKHPDGKTEVLPVAAWMPVSDGSAAPMVAGTGEFAGSLVYVGQDAAEPSYQFATTLIPPEASQ